MAPLSPVIGAVAQLEERLHGMQEVVGSIPIGSTSLRWNRWAFLVASIAENLKDWKRVPAAI